MTEMTNIRGQNFNPEGKIIILKKVAASTVNASAEIDAALKSLEKKLKEGDKFE